MITLSKRLEMTAKLCTPCTVFADIGTDHAYLPVYLCERGICSKAYACDIASGPLNNAEKTAAKYGMNDMITPVLCSGFEKLEQTHADCYCMAGMGGILMSDLIDECPYEIQTGTHLVLQPMTHNAKIRKYVLTHGFDITCTAVTSEDSRIYTPFTAVKTGNSHDIDECSLFFPEFSDSESADINQYCENEEKKLNIRLQALKTSMSLSPEIDYIENILNTFHERRK